MKTTRQKLLQIALLFGILTGSIETLLGQSTTLDNCTGIHYTDNQDKRCNECLVNQLTKDSVMIDLKHEMNYYKSLSARDENIIALNNAKILRVEKELNKTNLKLKISKKMTVIGVPVAVGVGFFVGILVVK